MIQASYGAGAVRQAFTLYILLFLVLPIRERLKPAKALVLTPKQALALPDSYGDSEVHTVSPWSIDS